MSLRDVIIGHIRAHGPLSFAEYMAWALYDPQFGYYTNANRRSGRRGDFLTSVDTGSLFGELLAQQFGQMWRLITQETGQDTGTCCDLVEVGAGDGRLASDILDRSAAVDPEFYAAIRYTLVERSPAACAAHAETLEKHASSVSNSGVELPKKVVGVIFANELLDALPVHPIVMTESGLREVYVDVDGKRLVERLGIVSRVVREHIKRFNIHLEPGWRAEVSPETVDWIEEAGRRLERGFLVILDYGHNATELYSPTHANGTLASYRHHQVRTDLPSERRSPPWLETPGSDDITAHVNLTAAQQAAESVGLRTLGVLDQTYFLLGLASATLKNENIDHTVEGTKRRLELKTLLLPGGLGSTLKVMIFSRNVGTPELLGCSFGQRATR